jgi:hypothetical protein
MSIAVHVNHPRRDTQHVNHPRRDTQHAVYAIAATLLMFVGSKLGREFLGI